MLERAVAANLGLPGKYLRPILPGPRHLKTTSIGADADGYPLLDGQLCVIDCDLPEPMVEAKHPALWGYLQTAQSLGIMDGYLIGKRSPWYRQERARLVAASYDPEPVAASGSQPGSLMK